MGKRLTPWQPPDYNVEEAANDRAQHERNRAPVGWWKVWQGAT